MIFEDFVTEAHIERNDGDAGALLVRLAEVRSGIRNNANHDWSIGSDFRLLADGPGGLVR